ncbi:MAG: serine protein kinase RIO [Candidatus Woesearchaeota archaeon]
MARIRHPEDIKKTFKNVFDNFTNVTILKLISKGQLDGLESPISIGKEANIFSALAQGERVMVKIYRIATCDFNKMYDYLRADPRFPGLDKNRRKVVVLWARREYRNLLKAREAGVRVPTPRAVLNNVLVMEFIGDEGIPAPRVKDAIPENPKEFFEKVVNGMQKLHKAGLVHTDLSQFNILNYNEEPVFIDMSQATTLENPNAQEYLTRDIKNICTFFRKLGLDIDDEKIRQQITGKKPIRNI